MPQPYQLKNLCNQKKYEEVAAFWNLAEEREQFSQWDYYYCMNAFYTLKRYEDCLEVYRACSKKFPDFHNLDDKMCWSLYHTRIKNFDFEKGNIKVLLDQIDYIFSHSSSSQYSPRWRLVKLIYDAIEQGKLGGEHDYSLALNYLDQVDPNSLGTDETKIADSSGHTRVLASDRESWYSIRTKALLKVKNYDECMACCDHGLQAITRFHSNNDSWFRYRKAKCLRALNRSQEAKGYVEQILRTGFSHWCLLQLMFEFETEAGNDAKALAYAGACSLSDPEHKMRVSFYEELADYLIGKGETESPMLLRRLVLLLRAENEWKEKTYHTEWQFSDEIAGMDKPDVLSRLNHVWREWRDKDKVFYTGTIGKLLAEGKSGFIYADNGSSYYFNVRDIQSRNREVQTGVKVRFTLADKLDRSKGVVKPNAVEITIR